jgi:hypothetical protein
MNGPVDKEGWMYSTSSTGVKHSSCGSFDHVRTRKWIRMRRIISTPIATEPAPITPREIENIVTILREKRIDRERLEALAAWVKTHDISNPKLVNSADKGTVDHGAV